MKKINSMILLTITFGFLIGCGGDSINTYTNKDWEVYNACKAKVYDGEKNNYDHEACREMLSHKKALKKYGAESSYSYWIKRLGK